MVDSIVTFYVPTSACVHLYGCICMCTVFHNYIILCGQFLKAVYFKSQ